MRYRAAARLPAILMLPALAAAVVPAGAATPTPVGIVRGIYADPGPAIENRLWGAYGAGYAEDTAEKHSGTTSIRCSNLSDEEAHGAVQVVRLDQEVARPIVISGWARLEGVSGPADYHCSVYLDLVLKDGQRWLMKIAAFDPARTGWQRAEQTYAPPAPIETARVYVFLRERKGTAWFDDIGLHEVLDAQGTRSANLLKDPGFEAAAHPDASLRGRFFGKLAQLGCNAFHMYREVGWSKVMAEAGQPTGPLPGPDPNDPLLDFIRDAHRRGFRVWLTVGLGLPTIRDAHSPEFPFWPCVNGRWGEAYTRAVAYLAQYGVDGIGMVPDEWNYNNSAVEAWSRHADPEVGRFYAGIPRYCNCETCRRRFAERTGRSYPDVRTPWSTADPVWADFMQFRYDSTTEWIRRSVEAARRANPRVVTDTMICVLPVCSDDRRETGAAWDEIGASTGLDCLQTDPYIQLHNYLGDSTHYYPTETTLHLAAANWRRRAGVTLEACRLHEHYRDKQPVEVYGAALSCLAHGAREFFWWHLSYLNGEVGFVAPEPPSRQVAAALRVVREMEPYVLDARAPGGILVAYSRTSEDIWHWLAGAKALSDEIGQTADPRRGFVAHHNVLTWLLRRGYPFRMTFLEHPNPAALRGARVVLVPFPFALEDREVSLLLSLARAGKTVVTMGPLAVVDRRGQPAMRPLLRQLVLRSVGTSAPGGVPLGKGRLVHLGHGFSIGLLSHGPPMKDPKGTVPLPAFEPERTAELERVIARALGWQGSLFAVQPSQDVEVALMHGARGRVLLATNWDPTQPAPVALRLPARRAEGLAIIKDASVRAVRDSWSGSEWSLRLAPQESRLVRLYE